MGEESQGTETRPHRQRNDPAPDRGSPGDVTRIKGVERGRETQGRRAGISWGGAWRRLRAAGSLHVTGHARVGPARVGLAALHWAGGPHV